MNSSPAPRPGPGAVTRPDAVPASNRSGRSRSGRPGRVRWRRIPGRVILAICFALGALALGAAVIPFTTTTDDGTELRCGPAVFEVLMPTDPAFDDTPENGGCAEPAKTRLMIAGGVIVAVLLVAGVAERRTRRGSVRRDTRWLSSSSAKASRRRAGSPASPRSGSGASTKARSAAPEGDRSITR